MDYPGNLFIVAAPSGAGKSSLVKALRELDHRVLPSISHTTRAPRGQEKDGREYHFVSDAQFDQMVADGAFLEWAQVHGHRSGTSKRAIEEHVAQGHDVILEIDYQGAFQVKRMYANSISIFILPPSLEELRARIERRGEDAPDKIALRMKNAADEIAQAKAFDFVIINEVFESALFDLKAIVHAERLTFEAQKKARTDTFLALQLI
ncbi:MAG: guanylate kinase [Cytophagales bacterium]|nr:guanylate kinase [Cytophagales bacterium]